MKFRQAKLKFLNGRDNILDSSVVVIPLKRYEELLDIESRVNVAVERVYHEKYISIESLLWILGTELAIETAIELRKKSQEESMDLGI